jgi:hypothetical protein
MIRISGPLKALIDAEAQATGPSADEAAACWAQIAADFERGALPSLDIPPVPPPSRHGLVLVVAIALGVGSLAAGLYAWRGADDRTVGAIAVVAPSAPEEPLPAPIAAAPESPRAPEEPAPSDPAELGPMRPPISSRSRATRTLNPVHEDTFAAELKLLADGHAALNRGDAVAALQIADTYKRTYPRGHFVEDREALRALAMCANGDGAAAARRFVQVHSRSIHLPRIREACALPATSDK